MNWYDISCKKNWKQLLLSAELYCYRKKNTLDFLFEKYKFSLLLFSNIIIRKFDFLKENKYYSLLRHQRNNCALRCFFTSYFQPAILAQQSNHNKILPSEVPWPPPRSSCTQMRTQIQIPTRRKTTRCLSLGYLITWGCPTDPGDTRSGYEELN